MWLPLPCAPVYAKYKRRRNEKHRSSSESAVGFVCRWRWVRPRRRYPPRAVGVNRCHRDPILTTSRDHRPRAAPANLTGRDATANNGTAARPEKVHRHVMGSQFNLPDSAVNQQMTGTIDPL
jgi:hypothetical protein